MKRLMTAVAALTLVVAACGGGDDSTSGTTDDESTADATTSEITEPSADDTDTAGADDDDAPPVEPDDESEDDANVDDANVDDANVDDADDDDADVAGGPEIRSISDMPSACRDAMAEWLRAIEPVVSPVDWEGATMADFEEIALEFETMSDEFETAISNAGCDDLNFVDDSEDDILIDFARTEAPGSVGFLEFLNQMRLGVQPDDDGNLATGDIETCQDAIDCLQGLMDDYDSIASVPAAELLKVPAISALFASCTPEQLEFFDNADLEEFMDG